MEELRLAIKQYLESREKLQDCLSNVEINKAANSADSAALLSIINDSFFEAKAFELLLHANADEAKRYINLFYLQGDPQLKAKFKGNLDDYRCILGDMEFKKLIDSLPKEHKEFYVIKEAIDFSGSE